MGNTARRIRPVVAARFALTVMLAAVAVAATAVLVIALRRGASLGEAWAEVAGAYPGLAAVAVVIGAGTLTLLLVFSPPAGRWGLGWRSALAGYAGLIAAALSLLLLTEWLPGQPGAAGGAAVIAAAMLGFTLAGGPLWIGLIAVLLGRTALLPAGIGKQRLSAAQRTRFGTVLIVAGLGAAALVTAGAYLVAVHGGLGYACSVEGPFSPLGAVSERAGVVSGSFSWWPLGRTCTWDAASGSGTVLATSGWGNTVFVAVLLGVAAAGIGLRTRPTAAELGT
ncbi:hypothetical protein [Cryobacterium sp. N22]|uniref:hypothetical protein n=1 Tax=Cryobacterium sp. N22 TaxID=2048290 RepID=UPI000CE5376B|nr:hypothetical protein [Cryobacterium sp. N22]